MPESSLLQNVLHQTRRRRQLLIVLRGVAIILCAFAAVLLLSGWAAHRFRTNTAALVVLRIGALLACLATLYFALIRPLLKRISDSRIARLIEEGTPGTEDTLVSEIKYSHTHANISPAIIKPLHKDANHLYGNLNLRDVIRRSRLLIYAS